MNTVNIFIQVVQEGNDRFVCEFSKACLGYMQFQVLKDE